MNNDRQHELNAYFDGELSSSEQERLKRQIATDPESQAYLACLEQTRQALASAHAETSQPLPAWETVKRERYISRAARSKALYRRAVLAGAAIILIGMATWIPFRNAGVPPSPAPVEGLVNAVEIVETDLIDATPIVYLDEPSGWTVVWVMEGGVAEDI